MNQFTNEHEKAVKEVLEQFCREYTGRDTEWEVVTWRHPVTHSVKAAVVLPEFRGMDISEGVKLLFGYVRAHLPPEQYRHFGGAKPMTPEEYERSEWVPSSPELIYGIR